MWGDSLKYPPDQEFQGKDSVYQTKQAWGREKGKKSKG